MNRPPYRSLCAVLALTLLTAAWLPAEDQRDAAGRHAPLAASPTEIALATVTAAPADVPAAPSAPGTAVPASVAEDEATNEDKKKEEAKEREKAAAEDAGEDTDKDTDKNDGKDEDQEEAEDDEAAGTTIARLRAFYKEKIGEFRRTDFHQYDEAGDDASVGYNLFRKGRVLSFQVPWVAFTAYFYPARGDSLDADLEIAIRDVTFKHEEAEVGEPEDVEVTRHGKKHKGRRVRLKFTHVFGGKEQPLASELYLFPGAPGRLVKYRITFPAADAKALQKKVDEFAESFPWPRGL